MADDPEQKPLMQPRVVRFLKSRRKLVDMGYREEFWDEMETVIEQRRSPDEVSQKAVRSGFERVSSATTRVVREGLNKANDSVLDNL